MITSSLYTIKPPTRQPSWWLFFVPIGQGHARSHALSVRHCSRTARGSALGVQCAKSEGLLALARREHRTPYRKKKATKSAEVKRHSYFGASQRAAKGQPKQGGRGLFRGKRKGNFPFANPKLHNFSILSFCFVEKQ